MSRIVEEAFRRLYPEQDAKYTFSLKYSGHFKDYNANVRKTWNSVQFKLSKSWRGVNKEIVIGLMQSLMLRLFKDKKETLNIDLYNNFIKSLHIAIPKDDIDPLLFESFNRVNEKYFSNTVETPNLVWGNHSVRKLGSYDYHTDTISISKIFLNQEQEFLDYVMYHEILHKKIKFKSKNGRNRFHTGRFKKAEKAFENSSEIEQKLKTLSRRTAMKKAVKRSFLRRFLE